MMSTPAPHEGRLFKKSPGTGPRHWIYQDRTFTLSDARLSWASGKGEQRTVQLGADTQIHIYNQGGYEFAISGTTARVEKGSASVVRSRVYRFRTETRKELDEWMGALQAHVAYERECAAKKAEAPVQQPHEIEPPAAGSPTLCGTLLKRSPLWPHPWQSRDVILRDGTSLIYFGGSGEEKGISLLEASRIALTDPTTHEFEIQTHAKKAYLFRAPDRASAHRWVKELQQVNLRGSEQKSKPAKLAQRKPPPPSLGAAPTPSEMELGI